jgi:hypothetical protein
LLLRHHGSAEGERAGCEAQAVPQRWRRRFPELVDMLFPFFECGRSNGTVSVLDDVRRFAARG